VVGGASRLFREPHVPACGLLAAGRGKPVLGREELGEHMQVVPLEAELVHLLEARLMARGESFIFKCASRR